MTKPNINTEENAWVLHREDIETTQDGSCHAYVLLDARSGFSFGFKAMPELPTKQDLENLLQSAFDQTGYWPKQILIDKKDPSLEVAQEICCDLQIKFCTSTTKELKQYVDDFSKGFRRFTKGIKDQSEDPLSDQEVEELNSFVPKPYDPCTCGSGEKFKFCCKKAFNDICFAMCAAEEGKHDEALRHMAEAEAKIGRTAEIVCRLAICWSFFDQKKSRQFLKEALTINPNHPRSNYIQGIDAAQAGNFELAVECYNRAIENCVNEDKFHLNEYHNNLGTAYFNLGDYKKAKESWKKGLVLLPSDVTTRENLIECIYSNPDVPENVREISPFMKRFV